MEGTNSYWIIGIGTGLAASLITLLIFIFSSSERSRSAASLATTSMQAGLSLQEKLRTAMWKQSDQLGAWEMWGMAVQQSWREAMSILQAWSAGNPSEVPLPRMPQLPPPPSHLDLSEMFNDPNPLASVMFGATEAHRKDAKES